MLRIGTSSWADREFVRDWYPPKLPAAARLSWYAEHFDYVEVNSTFYAIPIKKVVNRWDFETPSNFLFDVKLHGLLSRHAVKATSLPPDIRRCAETNHRGNLLLTPELEAVVAERILAEVEPLREAGKLGAFLLQLSPSFSPHKHKLDELEQLASLFRGNIQTKEVAVPNETIKEVEVIKEIPAKIPDHYEKAEAFVKSYVDAIFIKKPSDVVYSG